MSNSLKKLQFSRIEKVIDTFTVTWTQVPSGDLLDWVNTRFLIHSQAKTVSLNGNTATFGLTRVNLYASDWISISPAEIYSVNLSSLFNLKHLYIGLSNLNTIDVSQNTKLEYLDVYSGNLTSLSVSNNDKITYLRCYGNNITGIDLDQIYIDLDNNGQSNGTLEIDQGRTSASDTARANLISKGWTITEY